MNWNLFTVWIPEPVAACETVREDKTSLVYFYSICVCHADLDRWP